MIKVLRKIVTVVIILFIIFSVLEVFQRIRYFRRTKDMNLLFWGFKIPERVINIKESRSGFFREPFTVQKPGEGKNILFIGGSSTYGVFNDKFHTYPYLLGEKIKGVSCLNAAKPSMTSDTYLDILKKCYAEYCMPEEVVFYTGFNDLFVKEVSMANSKYFKYFGGFERFSLLLVTIREKLDFNYFVDMRKDYAYRQKFVARLENNIEECIRFVKDKGATVVIMPEVLASERFPESPSRDYRQYGEVYLEVPGILKDLAGRYDCLLLDPKQALYADWKNNFVDPVHLSDKGNEVLSDFLREKLEL